MADIEVTVEIDAPVAEVWRSLSDIDSHAEWMGDTEWIEFVSERHQGEGTEFIAHTAVGPIRLADLMTVTAWEDGRRIGVHHAGAVVGTGDFFLDGIDLGRRTRLRWQESLRFPWYFGSELGARVAARLILTPIWRRSLTRFRRSVEATS